MIKLIGLSLPHAAIYHLRGAAVSQAEGHKTGIRAGIGGFGVRVPLPRGYEIVVRPTRLVWSDTIPIGNVTSFTVTDMSKDDFFFGVMACVSARSRSRSRPTGPCLSAGPGELIASPPHIV